MNTILRKIYTSRKIEFATPIFSLNKPISISLIMSYKIKKELIEWENHISIQEALEAQLKIKPMASTVAINIQWTSSILSVTI